MQSTACGGELLPGGTPSRDSVLGTDSALLKNPMVPATGAANERLLGTCNTDTGAGLPDETSQQELL
jgi:hypothetical protein